MNATVEAFRQWRLHPGKMVRDLFGVAPDAWQEEALEAFPSCQRMCMKSCTGPGKAQPLDLLIDTPSGRRRWGSLQVGDYVFAEDGSPTQIIAVHPRGIRPVYRLTFDDGCSTRACGEHLWKVSGRTERRRMKYRNGLNWKPQKRAIAQGWATTTNDGYAILSTDEIIARNDSADGKSRRQFEIPRQGVVQYPEADLPIDPYVLGAWLGDGGRRTGRGSWRDVGIDEQIHALGYRTRRSRDGTAITVYGITQGLRSLGLFNLGSHERYVPDIYRHASAGQRAALLAGLMDTDGSIGDDGSMNFDVTSEPLVDDVAWLVRSLGGIARRRKTKDTFYRDTKTGELKQCRPCYRLTVTLPFNPFHVMHKVARWRKPQERYLTRHIDRIEPDGEAEVMCIEVRHPSHCYLTNDFIVTHNTALLAWLAWNFALTRPHSIIGVTSISADNLKSGMWTELARWYNKSELLRQLFGMTKTTIYAREHPDTWKIEARTWAKDADPSEIGIALRGLHAPYVMWLLDESGDYPDAIMPVCEAIFSGSPKEAHIIQAGNPIKLGGPLYQATLHQDVWKVINITADPDDPMRTPRVSVEHARQQIAMYGRDNPFVRVNIFGEFPPSSLNALIGPDEIMAATRRHYHPDDIAHSARVLGVDVARFGDDSSIVWPRQGLVAFIPMRYRGIDGIQGAGVVSRKWEDWEADACFVDDTGGFGASWIDNLHLLGRAPIPVLFSHEPNDRRYYNKRAEMYFDAAAWVKNGGQLPPIETAGMPEFLAAMTRTSYSFKGDRLILEPKEMVKAKLGYSPDDADAFVTTFAQPVAPRHAGQRRRVLMKAEYDPFEEFNKKPRGGMMVDFDPYGERR